MINKNLKFWRFFKDKQDKIWLLPRKLLESGIDMENIGPLDRWGFPVNLQTLVDIMNSTLNKKQMD